MQDARTDIAIGRAGRDAEGPSTGVRRAAAVLSLLLAGPLMADLPGTRPATYALAGENVVRLHATAVVTRGEVTLADVATVEGDAADLATTWSIAAAPHPGASGVIELSQLQNILSRRGVNLSRWVFRGSSRCVIARPAVASMMKPGPAGARSSDRAATRPADLQTATRPAGEPAPAVDTPLSLEQAIHAYLSRRVKDTGGTLSLRFSPGAARLLSLARPTHEFSITDRGSRALGAIPLEVTISTAGQPDQVVQVLCDASLQKQVVVAAGAVNRGEVIQAGHLAAETRTFERLEAVGLADAAALIGQRARRLIRPGEQIALADIEPMPLVERNDLVTVTVRRGGLTITGTARAMNAAGFGEAVTLRSELSKETFTGVVTGQKTVDLSDTRSAGVALAGGGR